ncbi:glutamyl-tRNA reductase [Tessaracoccus bendigoensis DSM 12906]|uniref:Glutamyl-tRNA reductase n=1 Tax=Tessaracoccus bendigoensis DSM 12906 TaxID=1123357 RepID=A0A1M6MYX7_9ACTN|nr:glutamyl-tRNA reductase [Tessaracoccus bendigoensis]SHJ88665.1 glutamyl-tRNA reductase [Tessaracoccus bendigoensis DSM 12906]
MTLRIFSIQHDRQGLSEVERISAGLDGLAARLRAHDGVNGVVLLGTCNRVELLLDTEGDIPNTYLRGCINESFATAPAWDLFLGEAALGHVFRVAAGLDSMVIGEREIAGQLRRALADAQHDGHASLPLMIAVEEALKTSRRVANETKLEGAGRSLVGTGLDLISLPDWSRSRVLIVGTGSYAGAVVAALRSRGVNDIGVHSSSGRGSDFARSHRTRSVDSLADGLEYADLVVTCRGLGCHVIGHRDITRPIRLLDLSLKRDVDPLVSKVPGVTLVDLATIQAELGTGIAEDTRKAQAIVNEGIADALTRLRARIVDPAVVGLREAMMALVEDEVSRLPNRALTHDDAALALRRLATRLLHIPSTRAKLAAERGRTDEYLHAMAELYGIGDEPDIDPNDLEEQTCPVTHLKVCDLEEMPSSRQAM